MTRPPAGHRRATAVPAALWAAALAAAASLLAPSAAASEKAAPREQPKPATTTSAPAPKAGEVKPAENKPPKVDEEFALNFYRERLPEAYRFVMIVKSKDPKIYDDKVKNDIIVATRRLVEIQTRRPDFFEPTVKDDRLTFRTTQLAKEVREFKGPPADLARKRQELTDLVAEHFEVRQELRKLQLAEQQRKFEEFRKHVENLVQQYDTREKDKATFIAKQVEALLKPRPPRTDF